MINFDKNCFQLNMAVNNGVVNKDNHENWKWLAKIDLEGEDQKINNFHIKCTSIIDDNLVIFARGQLPGMVEVCASFFLIFQLKSNDGKLHGFAPDDKDDVKSKLNSIDTKFKSIRLDQLSYAEFQAKPHVS